MGPLSKGEELMSKEHPLIETQRVMLQEFDTGLGSPSTLSVSITWGVKGVDRSDIGRWDASDMGVLQWDDEFTVAPVANQVALLQFCDYLQNESELVRDNLVECWIRKMDEWLRRESGGKVSLPLDDEKEFTR